MYRYASQDLQRQLERLATKEDNLLDLAADGEMDTTRVRGRLREVARQRREIQTRLDVISDDVAPRARYIDALVQMLEKPHELYRTASDATRRLLNQAIFSKVYIVNDEVVGD